MAKNGYRCAFCGRRKEEVMILVSGMDGHICENCVEQAQLIINDELNSKGDYSTINLPDYLTPKQIKDISFVTSFLGLVEMERTREKGKQG